MRGVIVVAALLGLPLAAAAVLMATIGETKARGANDPQQPVRDKEPGTHGGPAVAAPVPDRPVEKPIAAPVAEPKGPMTPVDITRVAPAAYGAKPWARLVAKPDEWQKVFRELHAAEGRPTDPLATPPSAAPFDPETEVIVVIGLGERARMDYAMVVEPVAPRGRELRLRLKIANPGRIAVEVVTRPAQAYRISRAAAANGVSVVDEEGYEIAAMELPAR